MTYSEILCDVSDRIATITLHRPDKLNAWTMTMDAEFRQAVTAAEQDPDVRVIMITGSGRGFCAGADMALLQTRPILDFIQPFTFLQELSKPVIAAINGPAVGLGLILTLYCDLRFASADARFGTAFARRGLIAEYGMAWMLPRLIGPALALDILLSARIFDAEEAARLNLVNRVYPSPTFLFDVRAYAEQLATQVSPRSLTVIKRQVFAALQQTLAEATFTAEQEMVLSLESEDFKEGVAHFLEKRPPSFTGA